MQVLPPQYKFNGLEFKMHSVQFSRSGMSDSLRPHEPQHARPPCPSPAPGVHPNPCPLSRCCHATISSSVVPFSSCPQSFPTSWQCLNWNITDLIPLMLLDGDRWTMLHAHLRVLSYHHFFCRVASIHCKAKHADSNERSIKRNSSFLLTQIFWHSRHRAMETVDYLKWIPLHALYITAINQLFTHQTWGNILSVP